MESRADRSRRRAAAERHRSPGGYDCSKRRVQPVDSDTRAAWHGRRPERAARVDDSGWPVPTAMPRRRDADIARTTPQAADPAEGRRREWPASASIARLESDLVIGRRRTVGEAWVVRVRGV